MTALDRTRLIGPLGLQGAPANAGAPCKIKTGSVEGTPKKGGAFFRGEEEQRSERRRLRQRAAERRSLLRRRTRLIGPLGLQGAPANAGAPCKIKTGSVEGTPKKGGAFFRGEEEQRSERRRLRQRAAERRSLLRRRTRLIGPLGLQGAPANAGAPCNIRRVLSRGAPKEGEAFFWGRGGEVKRF